MHPFLLLLGSACVLYGEKLGHTLWGGIAAAAGGLLQALAKRDKIPVLRSLPKFAPPGSSFAVILSILLLLIGSIFIGVPIASATPVGTATQIFLPVVGSGLLMLFDASSMVGLPGTPPTVVVLALCAYASACAHVQPVTNCVEGQLGPEAPAIIAEVETDLATRNTADLLLVAGRVGWATLGCILDELEQQGKLSPVQLDTAQKFKVEHRDKLSV